VTELCTIATRAQLAHARVLAADVREHHGAALRVLLVDEPENGVDAADEPFTRVPASGLGISRPTLLRLAMLNETEDLVITIMPALLATLLRGGAGVAVYLGVETVLPASLDELTTVAAARGAALVPRRASPVSNDRPESASAALDLELVAPHLIAVGPAALRTLEDWTRGLDAPARGDHVGAALFPGRAWIDDLIIGGAVGWLDDPTAAVSPRSRAEHAARCAAAARPTDPSDSAISLLADGTPIDVTMRALYRDALAVATDAASEPPNPLAPGGTEPFAAWLREPTAPDIAPRVGRYLARVWSDSALLRDEYPELEPATADAFEAWCRAHGDVPECVLPTEAETAQQVASRRRARPVGPRPAGVNLVGYMGATLGLGEVARNLAVALADAGVPVAAVSNPATASRELYEFECVTPDAAPYDLNLFVVTADQLAPLAGRLGPDFFAERRSIGLWFWEAERFRSGGPTPATLLLDEVWAPSAFVRGAVDAALPERTVETVPIPVPVPTPPPGIERSALGLPDDRFVLLNMIDYFSVTKRKNPLGLVDAYLRAFAPSDGATLVLKSINGADRVDDLEAVRAAAADRPDIVVWDEYLTPDRHTALLACCDAYVSLHRAEGLGLTMAEAMGLGKPVVATGYSGNLEFMDDDVAFLVRSTLTPIGSGVDPYPADARWAEPDLAHAATLMRRVFDDRELAGDVGRRAADAIRSRWSVSTVGPRLAAVLDQARARPLDPDGHWRRFFMRGWRNRLLGPVPRQYRFDWLADGFPLDPSAHAIFAYSLQRSLARQGRRGPPDPDGSDATRQMVTWLNAPIAPRRRPVVSRYLVQYWHDHPALQERFPTIESDRAQAGAYRAWIGEHWHAETDIDWRLAPVGSRRRATDR